MTYAIDSSETVTIGGIPQNIRIRTTDTKLPILLFLHGGPGVCDRHWVLKYQSSLAEVATMVCWDQRGAGLSYSDSLDAGDMTVSRMVNDARELVDLLRLRFSKDKIIIVGHSWGTLLGTLLAARYPDGIAAYIGMGQLVRGDENEKLSYDFVMERAASQGNAKALRELEGIGEPVDGHYRSFDDLMVQRGWMTRFGGGCYKGRETIVSSLVIPLLLSPEYKLSDFVKYYKGSFFSLKALWNEVVDCNLEREVPKLLCPVFLTEGRHDYNTPVSISMRWFKALDAPFKEWIGFEESAHSPIKEEPEAWNCAVRSSVKKVMQHC